MFLAINTPEGIDSYAWRMLQTVWDYEQLMDMIEAKSVRASWTAAGRKNAEAEAKIGRPKK